MYDWQKMTAEERTAILARRICEQKPWHRPSIFEGNKWFHVTASCYQHQPLIGFSTERMIHFSNELLRTFKECQAELSAWVLLPNHYHVLAKVFMKAGLQKSLGKLHGRNSHQWNVEEEASGRKCFHGLLMKPIKSESHRISTMNYIHHNPVKHGYVEKWGDWIFGSALEYLENTPVSEVRKSWERFPVSNMGKGWDD